MVKRAIARVGGRGVAAEEGGAGRGGELDGRKEVKVISRELRTSMLLTKPLCC